MRIVIIGNSGAGKSFLAKALAHDLSLPAISLDSIFWQPGGFNARRSSQEIESEIASIRERDSWIVEGVFGDLVTSFLDLSTHLLFLDLDWTICQAGLLERGSQSSLQLDLSAATANFEKLLDWSQAYYSRTDLRSQRGHREIFESFTSAKRKFIHRPSSMEVVASLEAPV